jgi:hypothetical protein
VLHGLESMARGEETIPLEQNYDTDFYFSSLDKYTEVYERKERKPRNGG